MIWCFVRCPWFLVCGLAESFWLLNGGLTGGIAVVGNGGNWDRFYLLLDGFYVMLLPSRTTCNPVNYHPYYYLKFLQTDNAFPGKDDRRQTTDDRPSQLKMWGYVNLGFFPFFCRPEMLDFSASPRL